MVDLLAPGTLPLILVVAGVALSVMEAIAPGAHFVVLGTALTIAGLAGLLFPPLGTPIALAVMVLFVGAASLWGYRHLDVYGGKGTDQTSTSASLAGREGVVIDRVTQTTGRVRLYDGGFDPTYSARALGEPIPEGARVLVIDPGGGSVLTVENVDSIEADSIDRELAKGRERRNEDRESERESET